jgi:phosphatidylinositol phospholipase C, delta
MNVFDQRPNAEAVSTTKRFNRLFSPARDNTALKPEASKITLLKPRQSNFRVEPVVTDGLSFVPGFSFREACEVIKAFAFYNNDLPVIVNISVHATSDQQEMMVQIMKEEWDGYLVDEPLEACDPRFRLPNLEDLRNRILVTLSEASGRGLPNLDKLDKVRRGEREDDQGYIPIIRPLADLEIYMRTESFQGFDTPRTKVPSHVFSLQEERLQEVISSSQTYLFSDNKNYFLHVTPSPARQDSSNLGPLQFWQHGIQMAAINWHNVDEGMMLNEGMFADESGWVLKPDGYRSSDKNTLTHYEAASKDLTELSILIFAKQEVELTSKDRANSQTIGLPSLTRATLHLAGDSLELSAGWLLVKDEDSGALGYEHKLDMDSLGLRIIPKLSILR